MRASLRTLLRVVVMGYVFALLLACASKTPGSDSPRPISATTPQVRQLIQAAVLEVIDGSTIDVEIGAQRYRVRYLGIDIPDSDNTDGGRTLSQRALELNRFLVKGKTVQLERDAIESDNAGRLLRYVYVGGEMVNVALLANGLATVSDSPPAFQHRTSFIASAEIARTSQQGIWEGTGSGEQGPLPAAPVSSETTQVFGTLPAPPGAVGAAAVCDFSGTTEAAIKGNVDSRTGEHIYHVPGSFFYSTIVIDEAQGDRWFCTEEQAIEAGWKRSKR